MGTAAWDLAHAHAARAGVALRPLLSLDDIADITRVMAATWGPEHLFPREALLAIAESGNIPWGAESNGMIVGYVLGWIGMDPADGLHVHSHMLAALPDRRHRGIGVALKLAQRAQALDQGVGLVRWTFDPMVARNAWLNLGKLGAVADRFHRNFYGEMEDSVNAGDRSDRLVVRWDLARDPGPRGPQADAVAVRVPGDYVALRAGDPAAARIERDRVADDLDDAFSRGLIVIGFERASSSYLLERAR